MTENLTFSQAGDHADTEPSFTGNENEGIKIWVWQHQINNWKNAFNEI